MKRMTNWLVSNNCLSGDLIDEELKSVRTSPIKSRDGNKVTTKSGSVYELIDPPHEYFQSINILRDTWGVNTPLEAVDKAIENNK